MNGKWMIVSVGCFAMSIASMGVACAAHGDDAGDSTNQDITSAAPADVDSTLVGVWLDTAAGGKPSTIVHVITLSSDGTYAAQGGCTKPATGAAACHAIIVENGMWTSKKSGAQLQLNLKDSFGQRSTFAYSVDGNDLTLTGKDGAKSVFAKQPAQKIPPGRTCSLPGGADEANANNPCVDGFECRSNCPANAECILELDTCQPQVRIKKGQPCLPGDTCVDGAKCKPTNVTCPPGDECFAANLDICQ